MNQHKRIRKSTGHAVFADQHIAFLPGHEDKGLPVLARDYSAQDAGAILAEALHKHDMMKVFYEAMRTNPQDPCFLALYQARVYDVRVRDTHGAVHDFKHCVQLCTFSEPVKAVAS